MKKVVLVVLLVAGFLSAAAQARLSGVVSTLKRGDSHHVGLVGGVNLLSHREFLTADGYAATPTYYKYSRSSPIIGLEYFGTMETNIVLIGAGLRVYYQRLKYDVAFDLKETYNVVTDGLTGGLDLFAGVHPWSIFSAHAGISLGEDVTLSNTLNFLLNGGFYYTTVDVFLRFQFDVTERLYVYLRGDYGLGSVGGTVAYTYFGDRYLVSDANRHPLNLMAGAGFAF